MLTLAYVPIISCQEKPPQIAQNSTPIYKTLPFAARYRKSSRRKFASAEKGKILSEEIVSVATNRRNPITRKGGGKKKSGSAQKEKEKRGDDDDEANASDVVSRDRRPSSSTTKAQHREATHKYIYAWAALC